MANDPPEKEICDICNGCGESQEDVTCWQCKGSGDMPVTDDDDFCEPDDYDPGDDARDWGGID